MNFVGFSSWTLMFSAGCFENLFALVGTAVDKIDGTSLLLIEDVTILMHPCFVVDALVSISDFVGRGDPTFGLFSVDNGFPFEALLQGSSSPRFIGRVVNGRARFVACELGVP